LFLPRLYHGLHIFSRQASVTSQQAFIFFFAWPPSSLGFFHWWCPPLPPFTVMFSSSQAWPLTWYFSKCGVLIFFKKCIACMELLFKTSENVMMGLQCDLVWWSILLWNFLIVFTIIMASCVTSALYFSESEHNNVRNKKHTSLDNWITFSVEQWSWSVCQVSEEDIRAEVWWCVKQTKSYLWYSARYSAVVLLFIAHDVMPSAMLISDVMLMWFPVSNLIPSSLGTQAVLFLMPDLSFALRI
jgi:hypothetical protein